MMVRSRFQTLVGCFALALVLAGCSSTGPGPRIPVIIEDPIAVDGAAVSPLTFSGVVVAIEPDTRLGFHYEGAGMAKSYDYRWGPNFSQKTVEMNDDVLDILGDAGYRTLRWPAGGVKETPAGETVLVLKATVSQLEFNSFTTAGGYYQAYCAVLWDLTDPQDGTSLFKTSTEGYKKEIEHNAGVLGKAFDQALRNLLADQGFVDAMPGK
ncbi:MAG: hypothetical protein ABFS42_06020 [Candidatus Krumholzibacteriota bacterium]